MWLRHGIALTLAQRLVGPRDNIRPCAAPRRRSSGGAWTYVPHISVKGSQIQAASALADRSAGSSPDGRVPRQGWSIHADQRPDRTTGQRSRGAAVELPFAISAATHRRVKTAFCRVFHGGRVRCVSIFRAPWTKDIAPWFPLHQFRSIDTAGQITARRQDIDVAKRRLSARPGSILRSRAIIIGTAGRPFEKKLILKPTTPLANIFARGIPSKRQISPPAAVSSSVCRISPILSSRIS